MVALSLGLSLSLASSRGIATLGGSGEAVGSGAADGEAVGGAGVAFEAARAPCETASPAANARTAAASARLRRWFKIKIQSCMRRCIGANRLGQFGDDLEE